MPFLSQAQRAWMYVNKPEMAKEWESHTPKGVKLPKHVKHKKMKFLREHFMLATGRLKTPKITNIKRKGKKK